MPSLFSRIKMARDVFSTFNSNGVKQIHLTREFLCYESAIQKLNKLQSNAAVLEAARLARQEGKASHVELVSRVENTVKYLNRTGINLEQVDKLSVIHVSGTKGKGTTCALCESILRHHGYRTGLFSSPHLIHTRERIRINGVPLSFGQFAEYFEEIYDKIAEKKTNEDDMPTYFKFMTVLALNVFIREKVDVAIIEVGIGGEYDSTNIIRNPAVVGITSLGLDHTNILGNSIAEIAWQKAGIMKPGTTAFTVPQTYSAALQVLKERAQSRNCKLYVTPPLNSYLWDSLVEFIQDGDTVRALNSSLALQMANEWMKLQSPFLEKTEEKSIRDPSLAVPTAKAFQVTKKMIEGLKNCSWPGRTQILVRGKILYFLDGAHTEESIKCCSNWFEKSSGSLRDEETEKVSKILIFNTTGQRDASKFLGTLASHNFDYAFFTTNVKDSNPRISSDSENFMVSFEDALKTAETNLLLWNKLVTPDASRYMVTRTVMEALTRVSQLTVNNGKSHVLITGSLHLIGNSLSILDPELLESVHHLPTDLKPLQNIYNGFKASL